MDSTFKTTALSRRTFLATSSAALLGTPWGGLVRQSEAAPRHPHRHNQLHTGHPTSAMYTGLLDIDPQGHMTLGIAESWEANKDLTAWVFRLRKGVLFHNGREVDAEAVKLNILHIKDPSIGTDFHRGAIDSLDSLDKYTVQFNTSVPGVSLPPTWCTNRPTCKPRTTLTKPRIIPLAPDPLNSSRGRALTRPGWCASKITGRRMPRAIPCPASTRSSANPSARTPCA